MNDRTPTRPRGPGSALLGLFARRPARSRRRQPALDFLEDRLAPAVSGNLYVVGTTLVYNGNFSNNNITLFGSDSAFSLLDTAPGAPISSVPGLTVSGQSITGKVPSYIQSIAIQGQNGSDVVNETGYLSSRNLILAGTTVDLNGTLTAKNVTATGSVVNLGAFTVSTASSPASPLAGSFTVNGTLNVTGAATISTDSVIDGNITLNGTVVGSASLTLRAGTGGNVTAAQSINLGGGSAFSIDNLGAVAANNVSLHQIVAGATTIRANNAVNVNGSLVSSGAVTINANLSGTGSAGFSQVAGDIVTTSNGASSITVGGQGNATIRGFTTGATGTVTLTVGGQIIDGNGSGVLNVNSGTLTASAGPGGISLDTSVGTATANVAGASGNLALRNNGKALTLNSSATANGNISVSNNMGLTIGGLVVAGGAGNSVTSSTTNTSATSANGLGNLTLSASVGNSGDIVNLNTTGDVIWRAGSINATNLNIVAGSAAVATPTGNIGGLGNELVVSSSPSSSPVIVNVTTTNANVADVTALGVFIVDPSSPMTITRATAQSGDISLATTGAANDLTVAGNVATSAGGAITLASTQNAIATAGPISSDTGAIAITPGTLAGGTAGNVSVGAGVTVSTVGAITVSSSVAVGAGAVNNIDISGTLASGSLTVPGSIAINGATGAVQTSLSVTGTVASSGPVLIDASLSTGLQTLNIGGLIAATTVDVKTGGGASPNAANLNMTGIVNATGAFTVTPLATADVDESFAGTINAVGVTIKGSKGAGGTVVLIVGTIDGGTGAVAITDAGAAAATSTFLLTSTGTITGGTVTFTGSTGTAGGGTNTWSIGGSVTATAGAIMLDTSANLFGDSVALTATTTGLANTAIKGSATKVDQFVVSPSLTTQIDFTFGAAANTLLIDTALANIMSSTAGFTAPITFNNGYQQWNKLAGNVTVAPVV